MYRMRSSSMPVSEFKVGDLVLVAVDTDPEAIQREHDSMARNGAQNARPITDARLVYSGGKREVCYAVGSYKNMYSAAHLRKFVPQPKTYRVYTDVVATSEDDAIRAVRSGNTDLTAEVK
jgi:hypothetical protein